VPPIADGEVGDLEEGRHISPSQAGVGDLVHGELSSPRTCPRARGTTPVREATPTPRGVWRRPPGPSRAWSPGDVVDVAEADELETGLCQHGEQRCPKKFETMIPSMLGTTWAKTMCQRLSPVIRAAWTKGRSRRAIACDRSTFAPHAQPVIVITPMSSRRLPPASRRPR